MVYHRPDNAPSSSDSRRDAEKSWDTRDDGGENAAEPVRKSDDSSQHGDEISEGINSVSDTRYSDDVKANDGRYAENYDGRHSSSEGKSNYEGRYNENLRPRNGREEGSRYVRNSRSREDDRYSRSRDDRREGHRDKERYDSPRYSDRSRHRDSSRYDRHEEGSRRSEGTRYSERSRYSEDSRYTDEASYGEDSKYSEGSRYQDDSRYGESSRYSDNSRYRGHRSEDWYSKEGGKYSGSRYDDSRYSGESSRQWRDHEQELSPDETSGIAYSEPEQEKVKNVFQNDGSFLEMFKKMQEASKPPTNPDEPEAVEAGASKDQTVVAENIPIVPKRPTLSIVGKRRGGRVLPTGMVKKQKREEEVEETPKDAWSLYIAELQFLVTGILVLFPAARNMPAIMPTIQAAKKKADEEFELKTAPFDPRFPNQNQTRYCYQSYVDYHRCQAIKGTDYEPCDYFKRVFNSICPNSWIEKWDTQIEENRFPGKIV